MRRSLLTALAAVAAVAAGCSSNTVAGPTAIVPPANLTYQLVPSGDPAVPVGTLLRWDAPADSRVVAFNVYSRGTTGAAWGLRATTTSASFYDLGIPDLQYTVTSMDAGGVESIPANIVTVDASNQLPAPTGLVGISLNTAIQLSWLPTARNAAPTLFSYYRVYSASYDLGQNLCGTDWVLEGTTVSEDFIASGLTNGVSRCFAVSAVSTDGHESTWSVSWADTPRPDARNVLITAFQQIPGTSGFLFYDASTTGLGVVTSGARADIDFRLDQHGDGSLWLLPVRAGATVLGVGPVADLTSIDYAPPTGYSAAAVQAVIGSGYVFQTTQPDGLHYGGLRVTALGTGYAIADWSYQTDFGNPELRRVRP